MLYVNPQVHSGYKDLALSPGSIQREEQALREFEQLFLFQMLKEMRKTVQDSGLLGDGMKRSYFEEMMDDVVAGEMAASGQLGLARQMAADLHAKEVRLRPGSPLVPGGSGIPIRSANSGIPIAEPVAPAFPIPARLAGIPVQASSVDLMPVSRAHTSYQQNR
jgi:hypothetical protein